MKRLLLGVSGSISLYKACDLVRELTKKQIQVRVVMTQTAARWISPVLFSALSGEKVYTPQDEEPTGMPHIEIRQGIDLFLIAPATAHLIAKAACGLADDILCQTLLSYEGPKWVAPAMNPFMWKHPATQKNIELLQSYGYRILPPEEGEAVCGDIGESKLMPIPRLIEEIESFLNSLQNIPSY